MRRLAFSLPWFLPCGLSAPTRVQTVLQRDFKARGQATMDRVPQDGLQRVCTESNDRPPAALAKSWRPTR